MWYLAPRRAEQGAPRTEDLKNLKPLRGLSHLLPCPRLRDQLTGHREFSMPEDYEHPLARDTDSRNRFLCTGVGTPEA